MALHQVFCLYTMASGLVFFTRFPRVSTSGALILMPSLGVFSFCWLVFPNFDMIVLVFSWYILFLIFYYYLLEAYSFLMRGREGVNPVGRGGEEELGGVEGGKGDHNQDICKKKIIFNKKKSSGLC